MTTEQLIVEVKKRMNVDTNKHGEYIATMAPDLLEVAEEYTNQSFSEVPRGVLLFIAKGIEYNLNPVGIESRSLGDVSYNYETEFPKSIMRLLRPYKRVKLHG